MNISRSIREGKKNTASSLLYSAMRPRASVTQQHLVSVVCCFFFLLDFFLQNRILLWGHHVDACFTVTHGAAQQVLSSVERMKIATTSHTSQFGLRSEGNEEEDEHFLDLFERCEGGTKMVTIHPVEWVGCKSCFPGGHAGGSDEGMSKEASENCCIVYEIGELWLSILLCKD